MAIAKVASAKAAPGANGGSTSGIDTTGASLLVGVATWFNATTATPSVSDSKTNSWLKRTTTTNPNNLSTAIWYAVNPSVGGSHTFTVSGSGTFPWIGFISFSGADTSSPFDTESAGGQGQATTAQPGSATPAGDNELFVVGMGNFTTIVDAIDSGFTLDLVDAFGGGVNEGGALAFKVQTTGGAENPTLDFAGNDQFATVMSLFKAAAAAPARGILLGGKLTNSILLEGLAL